MMAFAKSVERGVDPVTWAGGNEKRLGEARRERLLRSRAKSGGKMLLEKQEDLEAVVRSLRG